MDKRGQYSLLLKDTQLRVRIAALIVLGSGPFACREWKSLSILTLLSVFVGFSRSVRGVFAAAFGLLVAVLFCLARSSRFFDSHPALENALLVFSAYGVALYALSVIVPHLDAEEFLQRSRTTYRPVRALLVRVCHVVVLFLRGHTGALAETERNLRVAGVAATILRPMSCVRYVGYYLTSLWLYILSHSEAYCIAMDSRLVPWLGAFRRLPCRMTMQSYVVLLTSAIAAFVVFQDFVSRIFSTTP